MLNKIRIRNFRSVSDLQLEASDLNILIGKNDTGKSNILRALNLFFNNQTDFRTDFDFARDFSLHAKTGQGKAPEIRIDLQFLIPSNYQSPDSTRSIEWTKRWRANEDIDEDPVFVLKNNKKIDISGRSKIRSYLNNIDYHYIPALKGKDYFSELLSDIYDVLSEVSAEELVNASKSLQEQVAQILEEVSQDLKSVLNGGSLPKLPENLRSIFRLIQFESDGIDLDRRGDGIRVRHVPSLMKFLCELKSRRSGHYQSFHIWGLEEPENSVDFISAFELRNQIYETSMRRDFQIFMSTHSPVFFKLEEKSDANTFFFRKDSGETCLSTVEGDISDEMGVLRVVSPYVESSKAYIVELESSVDCLKERLANSVIDPRSKIVFVEGDSDVVVLSEAAKYLKSLSNVRFLCGVSDASSSANSVVDNIIAWHHIQKSQQPKNRVFGVGLVDQDDAGDDAKALFNGKMSSEKSRLSKLVQMQPNAQMARSMLAKGFKPRVCLESFAPRDCWIHAKRNGMLVALKPQRIIDNATSELRAKLMDEGLKSFLGSCDDEYLHLTHEVKIEFKKEFSEIFVQHLSSNPSLATGFSTTFKSISDAFSGSLV